MAETMPEMPPCRGRELTAAGVRTSYYHAGRRQAPPLVLLHGMSASADSFRELMHALAGDFCTCWRRTFPASATATRCSPIRKAKLLAWLVAFVEAVGVPRPALLGHSFGGALAVAMAAAALPRWPAGAAGAVAAGGGALPGLACAAPGEWRLARWLLNAGHGADAGQSGQAVAQGLLPAGALWPGRCGRGVPGITAARGRRAKRCAPRHCTTGARRWHG
jgi:pimeloyl-ACP methyl ester carboxylesterase